MPPDNLENDMTILIVDDMETNRKLLRAQLEAEGYDVLEACDGVEALDVLGHHPVAAVISDILMPGMDGYHLCNEIRKSDAFGAVPFIIYTATYTSPSARERGMRLGANLFIKKPVSAEAIGDAIARVTVENKRGTPQGLRPAGKFPEVKECSELPVTTLEKKNEDFIRRLLSTFRVEAADHIKALSLHLNAIEKAQGVETQMETVEAAFREAHSLKGAARSAKAAEIETLCRCMESVFSALKMKEIGISRALLDQLHCAVNALRSLASSFDADRTGAGHPDVTGISRVLEGFVKGKDS